jgi:PAS fold
MLWSMAPDAEPADLNQRILEYSGLGPQNFLNPGWKEFVHPEDFPETARAFYHASNWKTLRSRAPLGRAENTARQTATHIRWYGLSDIDESKKAENELRAPQTQLARASQSRNFCRIVGVHGP